MDTHVCSLDALDLSVVPEMRFEQLAELVDEFFEIVFDETKPRMQGLSHADLVALVSFMIQQHRASVLPLDL